MTKIEYYIEWTQSEIDWDGDEYEENYGEHIYACNEENAIDQIERENNFAPYNIKIRKA